MSLWTPAPAASTPPPASAQTTSTSASQYDEAGLTHIGTPVPVNAKGVMTDEKYNGQFYAKGNDMVVEDLEAAGFLLAKENIVHSYPHCWRCKHPIIYRATEQWFCSVDAIKDAAVKACDGISLAPRLGQGAHGLYDHRAQRLVHQPPAGVGRAHPHLLLRQLWRGYRHRRDHRPHLRPVPGALLQHLV